MDSKHVLFKRAFTHLYFLMLSADMIADLKEIQLGNKLIELEGLDKGSIMKELDDLSGLPRESVLENGINALKELDKNEQLKCLAYTKIMARIDGFVDEKENELLSEIYKHDLKVSEQDVFKFEVEIEKQFLDNN